MVGNTYLIFRAPLSHFPRAAGPLTIFRLIAHDLDGVFTRAAEHQGLDQTQPKASLTASFIKVLLYIHICNPYVGMNAPSEYQHRTIEHFYPNLGSFFSSPQ